MKHDQNQQFTLKDRLERFAVAAENRANKVSPGRRRDELVRKARQARTATEICDWLSSPNLQPPT
jgi:hypothetical protein